LFPSRAFSLKTNNDQINKTANWFPFTGKLNDGSCIFSEANNCNCCGWAHLIIFPCSPRLKPPQSHRHFHTFALNEKCEKRYIYGGSFTSGSGNYFANCSSVCAPLFAINLRAKNTHTPCWQHGSVVFFILRTKGEKSSLKNIFHSCVSILKRYLIKL